MNSVLGVGYCDIGGPEFLLYVRGHCYVNLYQNIILHKKATIAENFSDVLRATWEPEASRLRNNVSSSVLALRWEDPRLGYRDRNVDDAMEK